MMETKGSRDDLQDILDLLDATHADFMLVIQVPGEAPDFWFSNNFRDEVMDILVDRVLED